MISLSVIFLPFVGSIMSFLIIFSMHSIVTMFPLQTLTPILVTQIQQWKRTYLHGHYWIIRCGIAESNNTTYCDRCYCTSVVCMYIHVLHTDHTTEHTTETSVAIGGIIHDLNKHMVGTNTGSVIKILKADSWTCVCHLSHLCTLLKPTDEIRYYLAGTWYTRVDQSNTVLDRGTGPPREQEIRG